LGCRIAPVRRDASHDCDINQLHYAQQKSLPSTRKGYFSSDYNKHVHQQKVKIVCEPTFIRSRYAHVRCSHCCTLINWLEVQQNFSRFQSELQNLATKIGELEQEADEHV